MFKGPAALTIGSTVTAAGASTFASTVDITGNTTVGGTFGVTGAVSTTVGVTVGNTLTVSAGGIMVTSGGINPSMAEGIVFANGSAKNIIPGDGAPDGDSVIVASKRYVTQTVAASNSLIGTPVITSSAEFMQPAFNGNRHFRFIAGGYTNNSSTNMTCNFTNANPNDEATYKLSWHVQSGTNPAGYISVDFGASKILDAAGTAVRYIRLNNIGSSIELHYSTLGGNSNWLILGGSGATPTNTAPE